MPQNEGDFTSSNELPLGEIGRDIRARLDELVTRLNQLDRVLLQQTGMDRVVRLGVKFQEYLMDHPWLPFRCFYCGRPIQDDEKRYSVSWHVELNQVTTQVGQGVLSCCARCKPTICEAAEEK